MDVDIKLPGVIFLGGTLFTLFFEAFLFFFFFKKFCQTMRC